MVCPPPGFARVRSQMETMVPTPSLERIRRPPPCFSMICRMIHKPNPVPLGPLVVKNGVNSLGITDGGIPWPESATRTTNPGGREGSCGLGRTEMCSRPPGDSAAREFSIKLIRICRISPGWAVMMGSGIRSGLGSTPRSDYTCQQEPR